MSKKIPLTQGQVALVDDEDFERLNQHKWCACKGHNTFYAARNTPPQNGKRRKVYMHRDILGLPEGVQTDHRYGRGLDNRRANLRPATNQQNHFNLCSQSKNKTSKYKGVSWHKGTQKWRAQIQYNGKVIYLGLFDNEIEAAKAYDCKAREMFGQFALLNFNQERKIKCQSKT